MEFSNYNDSLLVCLNNRVSVVLLKLLLLFVYFNINFFKLSYVFFVELMSDISFWKLATIVNIFATEG